MLHGATAAGLGLWRATLFRQNGALWGAAGWRLAYAMGMSKFGRYYARFDGVRNDLTGLPPWARAVFGILILPGIVLVGLSFLAVIVSIAALLFLAIPVYMLLRALTASPIKSDGAIVYDVDPRRIEARRVDARVVDQGNEVPDEVNGE